MGKNEEILVENIWSCVEYNIKGYKLEGVEIVDEDIDYVKELMSQGMSLEDAVCTMLGGIRDCLDAGLDDDEDFDE